MKKDWKINHRNVYTWHSIDIRIYIIYKFGKRLKRRKQCSPSAINYISIYLSFLFLLSPVGNKCATSNFSGPKQFNSRRIKSGLTNTKYNLTCHSVCQYLFTNTKTIQLALSIKCPTFCCHFQLSFYFLFLYSSCFPIVSHIIRFLFYTEHYYSM